MNRDDMEPEPQLQFCDTSLSASHEEPTQVQPLHSMLKELKYSKATTFQEAPTKCLMNKLNRI